MIPLCSSLNENEKLDAPTLDNKTVPSLFWADDIVLISKSENGLKQSLKVIEDYASKWKMKINTDKMKILIFDKPGKVEKSNHSNSVTNL